MERFAILSLFAIMRQFDMDSVDETMFVTPAALPLTNTPLASSFPTLAFEAVLPRVLRAYPAADLAALHSRPSRPCAADMEDAFVRLSSLLVVSFVRP